jgi:hypothetical protein
MEGAEDGYAFATGMAAVFGTFAALLNSGDHILSSRAVFGSTHGLFTKFFAFVKNCREAGITAPIIPGLKPLATQKQLNMIPHRFHVDLPEALINEVLKAKTKEAVRQVGIDWCIAQSQELIAAKVPFLHYYSMGKSDNIRKVASAVF